ncbi:metallophosphoesterase family protein [Flavicella sediminum]|uniref:metallophosphoesterase family protein n=1 Tax=Flavicella sediminum TaxID=2585141 RepID=UPI0011242D6A|nr:metallophosphoesterase [Flavicella sediminum]
MKNLIPVVLLFYGLICLANNDTIVNTINGKNLILDKNQKQFSFLVAGHVYGQPSASIYPCPSLLSNIDNFNTSKATFFMLLGDNYRRADSLNINAFKQTFLNKIKIPVFNALGNHDIKGKNGQDYEIYTSNFTKETYYSFTINSSLFIVLDTELALVHDKTDGSITKDQLVFLRKNLRNFKNKESKFRKNIFIFTHKEIHLFEGNNYSKEIKPLLGAANTNNTDVYIVSGDIAKYSNDLYAVKDKSSTIHYVHTHLTDSISDKILKFDISKNGGVHIAPISLHQRPVKDLSYFNKFKGKSFFNSSFLEQANYLFSQQKIYLGTGLVFFCILIILGLKYSSIFSKKS